MTSTTRRGGWAIALAAGLLLAIGAAAPATAHEGPVSLEFDQDGSGGITLLARYLEDGHPVTEIIDPVATAIAADGSALEPVRLISSPEGQGIWVSPEPFLTPGFWTVTVTITTPVQATATANLEVVITDDAPPAPADSASPQWLFWAVGAAAVLFIGLLVALLVVRARRPRG